MQLHALTCSIDRLVGFDDVLGTKPPVFSSLIDEAADILSLQTFLQKVGHSSENDAQEDVATPRTGDQGTH